LNLLTVASGRTIAVASHRRCQPSPLPASAPAMLRSVPEVEQVSSVSYSAIGWWHVPRRAVRAVLSRSV
jgi:hypothetical protein